MSTAPSGRSRPNRFAGLVTVDPDVVGGGAPTELPDQEGASKSAASYGWPVNVVAPNPFNRRNPRSNEAKFEELRASIDEFGQLEPCAAVTREAFARIFPDAAAELSDEVGIVQVTGGRRLAAVIELGRPELTCHVNDELASDRRRFLVATGRENLDRADLDPIEEAEQVELLVRECGSGKEAAEQLGRTAPWVTYRINLLHLTPEVQDTLRSGELPLRDVRQWHRLTPERQLTALAEWRRTASRRRRADDDRETALENEGEPEKTTGPTRIPPTERVIASALRRLGGTPAAIGQALRGAMPVSQRRELAKELLIGIDEE